MPAGPRQQTVLHGGVFGPDEPATQRATRKDGCRWWRPTLVHWLGALALLAAVGGCLFYTPALGGGQQTLLTFQPGAGGSFLLPTPTSPPPTATPVRRQPPPPSGGSVVGIIQAVFGSYANAATAVARCESGLNPSAVNPTPIGGSHAAGLFQILYPSTWGTTSQAGRSPYDAQANAQAAYEIFRRDGYSWREWSCQP